MLETLITSKTRLKMLLKFFTNGASTAYLRGLAEEFDESTNAIRHELNNLSKAGYLVSQEAGRTILYRANISHPLYNEVKSLVHKYLDKIIDHVLSRLGDLKLAFIIGDYAQGKDTVTIELVLVGDIDEAYLRRIAEKATGLLHRKIKCDVITEQELKENKNKISGALLVWGNLIDR